LGGKSVTGSTDAKKKAEGQKNFSKLLGGLRGKYADLSSEGGAISTSASPISNTINAIARSPVGEMVGGALGTKEQSVVNAIKAYRPLLVQAIMQATGMSAKQLDSNVELKMYLDSATNPGKDIESNMAILNNLESLYGKFASGENPFDTGDEGETNNPAPTGDFSTLSDEDLDKRIKELQGGQ